MPTRSSRFTLYRSHPELILNLGSCLAVLAIVAIVSYLLSRERDSVEQSAKRSSSNIVQLIESDILRNVELYDQTLHGLIWAVKHPELLDTSPELRQQILFNQTFAAPVRGDILWVDAQGKVLGDSLSMPPRQGDLSDSVAFKAHRDRPGLGLFISPPFKARLGIWIGASVSAGAFPALMANSPASPPVPCACPISASCSNAGHRQRQQHQPA